MTNAILTFDLGGTNLKYGIGALDGSIFYHGSRESGGKGELEAITAAFGQAAVEMQEIARKKRMKLVAAGVGTPGAVNAEKGIVFGSSPNVPSLVGIPLKEILEKAVGMPVVVDNDANLATLGEAVNGGGKGYKSVLGLTLGTGVGGGFVQEGRLFRGEHGSALEAGHITIALNGRMCNCGKRGHLEAYASGSAIVQRANELTSELGSAHPREFTKTKPVFAAAEEGYPPAILAIEEAVQGLAAGIASLINTFDPGCVVIGGGVMFGLIPHWAELKRLTGEMVVDSLTGKTPILPAELGNMAGMVGAVIAARDKLGIKG